MLKGKLSHWSAEFKGASLDAHSELASRFVSSRDNCKDAAAQEQLRCVNCILPPTGMMMSLRPDPWPVSFLLK